MNDWIVEKLPRQSETNSNKSIQQIQYGSPCSGLRLLSAATSNQAEHILVTNCSCAAFLQGYLNTYIMRLLYFDIAVVSWCRVASNATASAI